MFFQALCIHCSNKKKEWIRHNEKQKSCVLMMWRKNKRFLVNRGYITQKMGVRDSYDVIEANGFALPFEMFWSMGMSNQLTLHFV